MQARIFFFVILQRVNAGGIYLFPDKTCTKAIQSFFFKKRNTLSLVYTLSLRLFFLLWRYTLRKDFFPINHKLGILVFHLVLSRGRSLVLNLLFSNFDVTLDRPISVLSNSIHSSKEWWISCWFVCGCFIVSLKAMGIASTTPISLKYWVGKICSQYLGTLKKFARVS